MSESVFVDYERDGKEVSGLAGWRILEHFGGLADEDVLESIKKRMSVALRDFPALAHETVNVGVLYENTDASAQAFGYNRLICLPPDEPTTNMTLWHELGHVAIRARYEDNQDVSKTSEEFCSIYSVARMPPDAIDEDRIPYIGEPSVPREEWAGICRRALEYRTDHRNYIQKCQDWLGTGE